MSGGNNLIDLSLRPRLKSGVNYSLIKENLSDTAVIYVGNGVRGLKVRTDSLTSDISGLPSLQLFLSTLQALNGHTSLVTISEQIKCSHEFISEVIEELLRHQLIDITSSTLKFSNRIIETFSSNQFDTSGEKSDGAYQSLMARIKPELEITTWYENSLDGGVEKVHSRIDFPVLIVGLSRIAIATAAILQASGFQSIHIAARSPEENPDQTITFEDISGGYIRPSDCGIGKQRVVADMNAQISLFPISKDYSTTRSIAPSVPRFKPRLIVSIGWPSANSVQEWMSSDTPFLIVDEFINRSISVGPLVVPGKSACINCVHLAREERDPFLNHIVELRRLLPPREVPAAVTSYIAGLISLDAIAFADLGQSTFLNVQKIFSLDSLDSPQIFQWGLHPECQCRAV